MKPGHSCPTRISDLARRRAANSATHDLRPAGGGGREHAVRASRPFASKPIGAHHHRRNAIPSTRVCVDANDAPHLARLEQDACSPADHASRASFRTRARAQLHSALRVASRLYPADVRRTPTSCARSSVRRVLATRPRVRRASRPDHHAELALSARVSPALVLDRGRSWTTLSRRHVHSATTIGARIPGRRRLRSATLEADVTAELDGSTPTRAAGDSRQPRRERSTRSPGGEPLSGAWPSRGPHAADPRRDRSMHGAGRGLGLRRAHGPRNGPPRARPRGADVYYRLCASRPTGSSSRSSARRGRGAAVRMAATLTSARGRVAVGARLAHRVVLAGDAV